MKKRICCLTVTAVSFFSAGETIYATTSNILMRGAGYVGLSVYMNIRLATAFLLLSFVSFGQNPQQSLSSDIEIRNLATTCKVWGYLKYYHPNVANGKQNWDNELIKILPSVRQSSQIDLNGKYSSWINGLGEVKVCRNCTAIDKDAFIKNFNLSWISDQSVFSESLISKLKNIEKNRFQGKGYYVTGAPNVGNIIVQNEQNYANPDFPEEHIRLLSLFRFWNIIEYFYPYKYLTDQNWDKVLLEMIPKFRDANSASQYQLAMLEIACKLDDGHGVFKTEMTTSFFGRQFIPAKLKIIDGKAVVTGFYNDSLAKIDNLKIGDVIESLDGKNVSEILKDKLIFLKGSNYSSKLRDSYYAVANGNTAEITAMIGNNGVFDKRLLHRYPYEQIFKKNATSPKYKIFEGNIGYINLAEVTERDLKEVMDKVLDSKAIIIDVRNYPTFLLYDLAKYFLSDKKNFAKIIVPDLSYPGIFKWEDGKKVGASGNSKVFAGKLIILVNEFTQSRGEFTAMALQAVPLSITIGNQTAGADGNVSKAHFVSYSAAMSGTGVFYPDGSETQRKGLHIDVNVVQTIDGIKAGRDEILEKALEYLKS